jgi:hypothetical protein
MNIEEKNCDLLAVLLLLTGCIGNVNENKQAEKQEGLQGC